VQAETTRTRLRRSCGISWDRSVIAGASPFAAIAGTVLYRRAASRRLGNAFRLNPNSGPVCPACDIGVALFGGLFCICEWPISASTARPIGTYGDLGPLRERGSQGRASGPGSPRPTSRRRMGAPWPAGNGSPRTAGRAGITGARELCKMMPRGFFVRQIVL
jgi:hypothetical protein